MIEFSLKTLEFETVRALVSAHAGSPAGEARIAALHPSASVVEVRERLGRTTEAVQIVERVGRQPYHDLPDIAETLMSARVSGVHLEPIGLADVASFIEGAVEIAQHVAAVEQAPVLAGRALRVEDTRDLAAAIRRAILPTGEVADDASPKLAELRRTLVRLRSQLTSVMESYLHGKDAERVLQDKVITSRNDRYVLLLKAEHRGQVPGIIHGSSGSGASLFVEPLPAVDLNNDIVATGDEERREVIRILKDLTARVAFRANALTLTVDVMGELDAAQAMALSARDMGAFAPEIVEKGEAGIELVDARHPLLMPAVAERLEMPRRTTREPVPVSLRVGFGESVLVISGPNTGGKTVALKTVGLLALMAQSGLHIPAGPGSRLSVFSRVFADIGDDQSIAANLSTFSAHLAHIVEMTRSLARPALVLLDEVGAGTDPTEGGALGVAIVDHFRRRGAMVVATTHHGLMKAYAQSTPGVGAASFGYDPETYEPTYRLMLGTAGRSLALEMAERLGLPAEAVQDARARLEQKEAQAEALLKKLEDDQRTLLKDQERLLAERAQLEAARAKQDEYEREAALRRRAEAETFAKDLRKKGEEAARRAADAIHRAVQQVDTARRAAEAAATRARAEVLTEIRTAEKEALADPALGLQVEPEPAGQPLAVGSRVKVMSLGVVGEVVSLGATDAELVVGGKRLRAPRVELTVVGGPSRGAGGVAVIERPRSERGTAPAKGSTGTLEVNLVGKTIDEALPLVDKRLDEAVMSDVQEVRVIHGFGSGRLRRAVVEMLDGHPHVASYRAGGPGEGGAGATIVEIKD